MNDKGTINVSIWFEDKSVPEKCREIYPDGMHNTMSAFLEKDEDIHCQCFTLEGEQLTDEKLDSTDVLIFYGHIHHADVDDELVDYAHKRVLSGMGLVTFHSGHGSKLFKKLMGTTCQLDYRVTQHEKEYIWTVDPSHPIVQGIGEGFMLEKEEVYREFHDIPAPDELVFISAFDGGEAFRSGCCWKRGAGRIFYFRPGHETCPTWHNEKAQRIIINAVRWAKPTAHMDIGCGPRQQGDFK